MNAPVESPATPALEQGFQLDDLRIDPNAGEATGPGGREKLDPKVIDVLVMLAKNARQVVLREDLLARLWPNVVVSDEVLSRCIYELRKQLAQAGGSERYKDFIETVPKRGYRLDADIAPIQSQAKVRPAVRSRRWLLAAAITLGVAVVVAIVAVQRMTRPPPEYRSAASKTDSVAVLPFVDMSESQDQGYLADGFAEEILTQLAQSNDLRVIARTSSFSFRGRTLDAADIAEKLDVSHLLEGSIRRSGDSVRVTAQLISAADSSHVWSQTYDRRLDDIFGVQDDIAASVASALRVALAKESPQKRRPASFEAFEKFAQAEHHYFRRAPGDVDLAVRLYKKAIDIDPRYARAWAALSGAYSYLAWTGGTVDSGLQRLQGEAARKAVALDPDLAAAHARLAQYYSETEDSERAAQHMEKARTVGPDDPIVLGYDSEDAFDRGEVDEAIDLQRRSVAHDPLNPVMRNNLAVMLFADERLDAAMSEYRKVLEINPHVGPNTEVEIVRILIFQRRYDEARSEIAKLPEGKYRDHGTALLYRDPGSRAAAEAAYARLAAQPDAADIFEGGIMDRIRLAEVQAFRGSSDAAFATLASKKDTLERRWGPKSGTVWYFGHETKVAPFLNPLHADPRWEKLVAFEG